MFNPPLQTCTAGNRCSTLLRQPGFGRSHYRSLYDPALTACALYDRCQPFVEVVESWGTWAGQPVLLGGILDHTRFGTDL